MSKISKWQESYLRALEAAGKADWQQKTHSSKFDDVSIGTQRLITFPGVPGRPERVVIFTRHKYAWSAKFIDHDLPISTPRGRPYKEVVQWVSEGFKHYDETHRKN